MIPIQEHNKIPYDSFKFQEVWKEGMRLPGQDKGLDRWFFQWQWQDPLSDNEGEYRDEQSGYSASYVVGAQWFDKEQTLPLVVTTKHGCSRIDFLKLFSTCFNSGIASKEFSRIYDVDIDQPRIKCPELNSVLSPLIVVHFVSIIKEIVKRGLKKDYVPKDGNLKKIKGRIDVFKNERVNIIPKRYDRIYCRYQEYSENTQENRLLKKALLFAKRMIDMEASSDSISSLTLTISQCLSAFTQVDDQIEVWEVKSIKHHKLFKEYDDAIKLAQMILRRYDYNITNITPAEQEYCPIFWVDMSLLYEHYVLGLLKEAYGDKIHYQKKGHTGKPDCICNEQLMVMVTKYIPRLDRNGIDTYIARQLSGYSRDRKLFGDRPLSNIPCVILYPKEGAIENPFKNRPLELLLEEEDASLWNFHRIPIPLPVLDTL